jgi:hypothetical protein
MPAEDLVGSDLRSIEQLLHLLLQWGFADAVAPILDDISTSLFLGQTGPVFADLTAVSSAAARRIERDQGDLRIGEPSPRAG